MINKFKDRIFAIGVSVPGPCDYEKGVFFHSPNLPKWNKFQFKSFLAKETGVKKIVAQNDANLMALAHHHYFKLSKKNITQFFTISTGLGACLIINNKIFVGSEGFAQEVAWFIPNVSGKNKENNNIEYFASGGGITRRAKEIGFKDSKDLFENCKKNKKGEEIIANGIDALSDILSASLAFNNPSHVIFDGPLARNHKWFIKKIIEKTKKKALPVHSKKLKFLIGKLKDDAALFGAFTLIKQNF